MPSREDRLEIIWSFRKEGDPAGAQRDAEGLDASIRRLTATSEQLGKVSETLDEKVQKARRSVEEHKSELSKAGDAAYHFGQGAAWANIPGTQFLATSGNLIQGMDWMAKGLGEATSKLSPLTLGIVGVTVGVAALGAAMITTSTIAKDLVGYMRDLAGITGLGIDQTGKMLNGLSVAMGGAGARGAVTAIATGQAHATATQIGMEASATPGQYIPELVEADPFAAFGINRFGPGATLHDRRSKKQDVVLGDVAQGIAQRRIEGKDDEAAQMLNILGPAAGGTEAVERLAGRFERGLREGKGGGQIRGELQQEGAFGRTPSKEDVRRVQDYEEASNKLGLAWSGLTATVGVSVLPVITGFVNSLTAGVGVLSHITEATMKWMAPLSGLGYWILQISSPIVKLVAAFGELGRLFGDISGTAPHTGQSLKGVWGGLDAVKAGLTGLDWTGWSQTIAAWGDKVGTAFGKAAAAVIDYLGAVTGLGDRTVTVTATGELVWSTRAADLLASITRGYTTTVTGMWRWPETGTVLASWIGAWMTGGVPDAKVQVLASWLWVTGEGAYNWFVGGAHSINATINLGITGLTSTVQGLLDTLKSLIGLPGHVLAVAVQFSSGSAPAAPAMPGASATRGAESAGPSIGGVEGPGVMLAPSVAGSGGGWDGTGSAPSGSVVMNAPAGVAPVAFGFAGGTGSLAYTGNGAVLFTPVGGGAGVPGYLDPNGNVTLSLGGAGVAGSVVGHIGVNAVSAFGIASAAMGGIAGRATLTKLADAGEPEAVIPLGSTPGNASLPGDLGGLIGRGGGGGLALTLNLEGMDVSDDLQFAKIARAVGDRVVRNVQQMTGVNRFYQ